MEPLLAVCSSLSKAIILVTIRIESEATISLKPMMHMESPLFPPKN